jgi:hypothetical protein
LVFFDADVDHALPVADLTDEVLRSREHLRGVEDGAGSVGEGVEAGVGITARSPLINVGREAVPVGVSAGGLSFADAGIAVADADGLFLPNGVRELGEASVFLGHDECLAHHSSCS